MVRTTHEVHHQRTMEVERDTPEIAGNEDIDELVGRFNRIDLPHDEDEEDEEEDEDEGEDEEPEVPLYIEVFCHGSARGNGQSGATGAYACVFPDYRHLNSAVALAVGERATNQRTPYQAALEAIQIVNRTYTGSRAPSLRIITNNNTMNKSMNEWREDWETNGWRLTNSNKKAKNRDLIQAITNSTRPGQIIAWLHYDADFIGQDEKIRALEYHEEAARLAKHTAPARR